MATKAAQRRAQNAALAAQLAQIKAKEKLGRMDIAAKEREARRKFTQGRDLAGGQYERGRAQLGQDISARGLGWSGLRTGAQGRQLADFTTQLGEMTTDHQSDMDALERALYQLGVESKLARRMATIQHQAARLR